jgi:GR25 family glycosyltransferase involved in LPS biosynthesis
MNSKIYKLFNPDLGNFNNNQLLLHYNRFGKKENRIYSLESFFNLYPYYNDSQYRLYNNDLNAIDKVELMAHWHLHGKSENRICSDLYFEQLYPNFAINNNNTNIHKLKNSHHRKENNIIENKLSENESVNNKLTETDTDNNSNTEYKSILYDSTIDKNIYFFIFVIISNNSEKINSILSIINKIENNNLKVIIVTNNCELINKNSKLELIIIYHKIQYSTYLIKNTIIEQINYKDYKNNQLWTVFINEDSIIEENIIDNFFIKMQYRNDLDIIISDSNIDYIDLERRILCKNEDCNIFINYKVFKEYIRFKYNSIIHFLENLNNKKYKILINKKIINDKLNISNINLIKNIADKNTIVSHVNDSFEDSLYNIFIGITLSFLKNYNFIITVEKSKEYLFKKYTLFKSFDKIIINNIQSNEKSDIIIKNNTVLDESLISGKKYNIIFNIIKSNEKSMLHFKNNFSKIKNLLNMEKEQKLLNCFNTLNISKKNIGLYISSKNYNINFNYDNYFSKCLSYINYHNMNIIIFTDNDDFINNINFLKNLTYYRYVDLLKDINEESKFLLFSLCDYTICDESMLYIISSYFSISKQIYFPSIINTDNLLLYDSINIVDDNFDDFYLQNNVLITEYDSYILIKNNIYNIRHNEDIIELNINKLYVKQELIEKYDYKTSELNLIKFNFNINTYKNIPYEIIQKNNKYYYKLYDDYSILDINNLANRLPLNFKYINVYQDNFTKTNECFVPLNLKINIIFIIDNINNYTIYNILFFINQNYDNYNIILFFNNISVDKEVCNYVKTYNKFIFIFSSTVKLLNIEILNYLVQLSEHNSLILVINNYPINIRIMLSYINLLFFSRKLLVTDYYSCKNSDVLIFNRELFSYLNENIINKEFNNSNNINYLKILGKIFKKLFPENSFVENYENNLKYINSFSELNSINYNEDKLIYNLSLNNYLSRKFDNYSKELILLLNNENNIKKHEFNENKKSFEFINNNENYLDFLIHLYKSNFYDYDKLNKTIISKIVNNNKKFQIIIFIKDNSEIEQLINILENGNSDFFQINIIEFGTIYEEDKINNLSEKYNVNFFFLDTSLDTSKSTSLDTSKDTSKDTSLDSSKDTSLDSSKTKYNRALSYNLMINLLNNKFEYEYIIFLDINYSININKLESIIREINNYNLVVVKDNILENENKYIIIFEKDILEEVGNFDPEIFNSSGYELLFLINKIEVYNLNIGHFKIDNLINKIEYSCLDIQYENYYKDVLKLFNEMNKTNQDIYFNYIKNRYEINYNIIDKIKTYVINLDSRPDRLNQVWNICKKNGITNFERFPGIVPTDDVIRNSKLINPRKILKKNVIEYLRGSLGCKMSHLEVLKKAQKCSEDLILIIEDDVVFDDNFSIYLNLSLNYLKDKDWDILFLSSNLKNSTDAEKVDTNTLKIINGLTTTAQLFQRKNLEKIINIIEHSECEIDNTYNDLLEHKYCVYPMCCYQRESHSDIIGVDLDYGYYNKKFFY